MWFFVFECGFGGRESQPSFAEGKSPHRAHLLEKSRRKNFYIFFRILINRLNRITIRVQIGWIRVQILDKSTIDSTCTPGESNKSLNISFVFSFFPFFRLEKYLFLYRWGKQETPVLTLAKTYFNYVTEPHKFALGSRPHHSQMGSKLWHMLQFFTYTFQSGVHTTPHFKSIVINYHLVIIIIPNPPSRTWTHTRYFRFDPCQALVST